MIFHQKFCLYIVLLIIFLLLCACHALTQDSIEVRYHNEYGTIRNGTLWEYTYHRMEEYSTLDYFIDSTKNRVYVNSFDVHIYALDLKTGVIIDEYPLEGKVYGRYQNYRIEKVGSFILLSSQKNFLVFSEGLELKDTLIQRILREHPEYDWPTISWRHAVRNDSIVFTFKEYNSDDPYIDSVTILLKDYE